MGSRCDAVLLFHSAACSVSDEPSPHAEHLVEGAEEWMQLYELASAQDLWLEIESLRAELTLQTDEHYRQLFHDGVYSVEGQHSPGVPFPLEPDYSELCEYRFLPDGTVGKAVLPESDLQQDRSAGVAG